MSVMFKDYRKIDPIINEDRRKNIAGFVISCFSNYEQKELYHLLFRLNITDDFHIDVYMLQLEGNEEVIIHTAGLSDGQIEVDQKDELNNLVYRHCELLLSTNKNVLGVTNCIKELDSVLIDQSKLWILQLISDICTNSILKNEPIKYGKLIKIDNRLHKYTNYRGIICNYINGNEIVFRSGKETIGLMPLIFTTKLETEACTSDAKSLLQSNMILKVYGSTTHLDRDDIIINDNNLLLDAISEFLI